MPENKHKHGCLEDSAKSLKCVLRGMGTISSEGIEMVGSNGSHGPSSYQDKFADFIRLLGETKEDVLVVHHPEVLGDTYNELVESLNRIADAKKHLAIMPRAERTPGVENW